MVENYPGFPEGISGFELGQRMEEQAKKFGLEILSTEVMGIELWGKDKVVHTSDGDYIAPALILATGSEYSKLSSIPDELVGRGVSYCATCDGPLFKGQEVAVVGGGDTAISDALYLSKLASKVFVIHRRDQLRAAKDLQERALVNPKMEFLWNTIVEGITGNDRVEGLELRNVKTGESSNLKVPALFVAVGLRPNTEYLKGFITLALGGFVTVDERMETELPGVFAAGDIRYNSIRQVVAAAGDGAIAAHSAEEFLGEQR
jgi:thioredoxin reductase (NADPH)